MPKTGTTALQRALAENHAALGEAGVVYPTRFRDSEGTAHHALSAAVVRRSGVASVVDEFVSELDADGRDVLVSSEAFTNGLAPATLPQMLAFIERVAAIRSVRFVLTLRRIDAFMESMYLHSVKTGDVVEGFSEYVARRRTWMGRLLAGLAAVRQRLGADRLTTVRYGPGAEFAGSLCEALDIPVAIVGDDAARERNPRLGLKAQVALLHLDAIAAELGSRIDRATLIREFETGRFVFEEDRLDYRLMPAGIARRLHADAVAAARATGESAYADYFAADTIDGPEAAALSRDRLTAADRDRLAAHVSVVRSEAAER